MSCDGARLVILPEDGQIVFYVLRKQGLEPVEGNFFPLSEPVQKFLNVPLVVLDTVFGVSVLPEVLQKIL